MKEMIIINVGGAGIKIGDKTWQMLSSQHHLTPGGLPLPQDTFNNSSIFQQTQTPKLVPRTIFIDTSSQQIDELQKGERRNLYGSKSYISGKEDTSNNFIRGHYTIGRNIIDDIEMRTQQIIQSCDYVQGVIINCSLGGGTGSGVMTLLLERLINKLQKKTININVVLPSPHFSDCIVESYNAILALGELVQMQSNQFYTCFDNQQLYKQCNDRDIEQPGFNEINEIIAHTTCLATSPLRSYASASSFADILINTIPYRKISFLTPHLSTQLYNPLSHEKIICQLYNPSSSLLSNTTSRAILMGSYSILRGNITSPIINEVLLNIKQQSNFARWCPTGAKVNVNYMPVNSHIEGLDLQNSASFINFIDNVHNKYDRLFDKRAFVHWFVGEGIADQSFRQGRQITASLEAEYRELISTNQD